MRMRTYILCCLLWVVACSQPAFAFKASTHVASANAALDELTQTIQASDPGRQVVFRGITFDLTNAEAYRIVLRHPREFRMGAVGPDAFPDLVSGQLYLHTNNGETNGVFVGTPFEERDRPSHYRSIDYAMRLLKLAKEEFPGDEPALAFALGYFGHVVGDAFAHTFVNEFAGDFWSYFEGGGLYGPLTEEVKHFALETYADFFVPDRLRNDDGTNAFSRMELHAPYDFLDQYFDEKVGGTPEFVGGRLYNYFDLQTQVAERLQDTVGGALNQLKRVGQINPFTASGIGSLLRLAGTPGWMADAIAGVLPNFLSTKGLTPVTVFVDEITKNLDNFPQKTIAYRRNWLVMSKCTMENIVKAYAQGNTDDCSEVKSDVTFAGVDGTELTLFRQELLSLFDTPRHPDGSLQDFHKASVNVKRQLAYLESSFKLDDLEELLVPATLRLAWEELAAFIRNHREEIALFLAPVIKTGATAACGIQTGVCEARCLAAECVGGLPGCIARREEKQCRGRLRPWLCFDPCPFVDCPDICAPNPLYPPCLAAVTAWCTGESAFNCTDCAVGCTTRTLRCIQDALLADPLDQLEAAMRFVLAPIEEIRAAIRNFLLEIAEDIARDYGVPVDDIHFAINLYKSLETEDDMSTPPHFLVNIAFLQEDVRDHPDDPFVQQLKAAAQSTSQQLSDFLEALQRGEPLDFLTHCTDTPDQAWKGDAESNLCFRHLKTIPMFRAQPGPTAQRFLNAFGDDLAEEWHPLFNAIQAIKLVPLDNKSDIENTFVKVGAPISKLPWNIAPSSLYSDICSADLTITVFCDAVASLDDPSCIHCDDKPLDAGLERNLEIDPITGWVRKRSLVAWEGSDLVTTPFMLANDTEVEKRIYQRIFRVPGTNPALISGDFNRNGIPDLITRDTEGRMFFHAGSGTGGFASSDPEQIGSGWQGYDVVLAPGDFNRDGTPDLISRGIDGTLWFHPGNGQGGFALTYPEQIGSGWQGYDVVLAPGDFNRDGIPDLISRGTDGTLWFHPGNGQGGFALTYPEQIGSGWQGYDVVLAPGDFNRDGIPDLISRGIDGTLWFHPGNGQGGFALTYPEQIGSGWQGYDVVLAPGDFNRDGTPDLISRGTDGTLWFHPGNGQGGFALTYPEQIGSGWQGYDVVLAPGDFNRDGTPDLISRGTDGTLWFHPGNGQGGFALTYPEQIGSGWQEYY